MRARALVVATPARSFYVAGTPGPLLPGELDRARRWGEQLGLAFIAQRPDRHAT
jgi:hypothetical protein